MTRRQDIDLIKGLAIIAVVLFHMGVMEYGYPGTDYIDMFARILTRDSMVIVFDGQGHYLSHDSKHLTPAGARFYAHYMNSLIDSIIHQKTNRQEACE